MKRMSISFTKWTLYIHQRKLWSCLLCAEIMEHAKLFSKSYSNTHTINHLGIPNSQDNFSLKNFFSLPFVNFISCSSMPSFKILRACWRGPSQYRAHSAMLVNLALFLAMSWSQRSLYSSQLHSPLHKWCSQPLTSQEFWNSKLILNITCIALFHMYMCFNLYFIGLSLSLEFGTADFPNNGLLLLKRKKYVYIVITCGCLIKLKSLGILHSQKIFFLQIITFKNRLFLTMKIINWMEYRS